MDMLGRLLIPLAATLAALSTSTAQGVTYVSSVVMSGLNNPRGLAFGPNGDLWVAESGFLQLGGPSVQTRGLTFVAGTAGSISRFSGGIQTRVLSGVMSIAATDGSDVTGLQDIVFGSDGTGYAVVGFIGDPALRSVVGPLFGTVVTFTPSGIAPFADVAILEANTNPAGRELNSNPFHAVAFGNGLAVTDAGSNTLVSIANGSVSNLATFPARSIVPGLDTDSVPTGVAVAPDGSVYVAELTGVPFVPGNAGIYRVATDGKVTIAHTGFTNITDIAFGSDGTLFVLQFDDNGIATPGVGGSLISVGSTGTRTTLFNTGLINPTGLAIGGDGAFYVTNFSAGAPGSGQVLRIAAVPEPTTWLMMIAGFGLVGRNIRQKKAGDARTRA